MIAVCSPGALSGTVRAIPSKSDAHRKLICAALSENGGVLPIFAPFCDDIAATVRCLSALGAGFTETLQGLRVTPVTRQPHAGLDCGESGSTLRFLLPVAMTVCGDISVTGAGRLPARPIGTLVEAMSAHGVQFSQDRLPLRAAGTLTGGSYSIEGNISSQFLSGLLMALANCGEPGEIRLTTPLQSAAYVDMTLDTLRLFGAKIDVSANESGLLKYTVHPGRLHMPNDLTVDGDWSNAAFWLAAPTLRADSESPVTVTGLAADSTQGDRAIWDILRDTGAELSNENNAFTVKAAQNRPLVAEMERIPDLLPILAVKAAFADGSSEFVKAERLRLKESDRLAATAQLLRDLGGAAEEHPDGLSVHGGQLRGGTVDSMNDHRLVMAAAVAATACAEPVRILGAEAVNKSYPGFFADFRALGGRVELIP